MSIGIHAITRKLVAVIAIGIWVASALASNSVMTFNSDGGTGDGGVPFSGGWVANCNGGSWNHIIRLTDLDGGTVYICIFEK